MEILKIKVSPLLPKNAELADIYEKIFNYMWNNDSAFKMKVLERVIDDLFTKPEEVDETNNQ